jgi:hypothetical protein
MRVFFRLEKTMTHQEWLLLAMGLISALSRLVVVVPVMFWMLRKLDTRSGINFKQWWEAADARSRSIYLSARLLVVCLLLIGTMA